MRNYQFSRRILLLAVTYNEPSVIRTHINSDLQEEKKKKKAPPKKYKFNLFYFLAVITIFVKHSKMCYWTRLSRQ
jgi:hypothetical protein